MSSEPFETTSEWDYDRIEYSVDDGFANVKVPFSIEFAIDGPWPGAGVLPPFDECILINLTKAEAEQMSDALNRCLEQFK